MNPYLFAWLLGLAMAFTGGWSVNQWRNDSAQKHSIEQAAESQREVHAMEQKRLSGVISAQNASRTREVTLRRDADTSRAAADWMRDQADEALRLAGANHSACLERTSAATELLLTCSRRYSDLGAAADRHVSDIKTMIDSQLRTTPVAK